MEKYERLEIDVIRLNLCDIITSSNPDEPTTTEVPMDG